ncbi:N-6 DNA methylase [Parabacteroides merdae]|uniref:N-6 DNA methylase n=1 Tax=Parabacteroides merdae TaxID=46503 RepID=UPI0034D71A66
MDASGEDFFKKVTNNNILEDKHIKRIMEIFDRKEDVDHVAISVDNKFIAEKDYNPLAELNKRIFKSANRFVVNVVYILKDCKCTYFP